MLSFRPRSGRPKVYCRECRYKHPPNLGLKKPNESKGLVSAGWRQSMAILEGALGNPNSEEGHQYQYEKAKNKHYSEAYLAGLIGEKEGRKWLGDNGFEVYEFSMMFHIYFGGIDNNISEILRTYKSMRHRRKAENKAEDKQLIEDLKQGIIAVVGFLKVRFGQNYVTVRRLFLAIDRTTKQNKVGERYPDFIVIKQGSCSLVEAKANKSKFYAGQVECFELAESFGLMGKVLKVTVEANKAKDIELLDYKSQLSYYGVNYR